MKGSSIPQGTIRACVRYLTPNDRRAHSVLWRIEEASPFIGQSFPLGSAEEIFLLRLPLIKTFAAPSVPNIVENHLILRKQFLNFIFFSKNFEETCDF